MVSASAANSSLRFRAVSKYGIPRPDRGIWSGQQPLCLIRDFATCTRDGNFALTSMEARRAAEAAAAGQSPIAIRSMTTAVARAAWSGVAIR